MRNKITTIAVNRLQAAQKPFEVMDTDIKGFLLRVQPSGGMTYYFSYRTSLGKKARIKIGAVGNVSVKQARDKATSFAGQVTDGIDIQQEKKAKRDQAKNTQKTSLGYFIDTHYKPWVLANRKSGQATLDTLTRHFEPWYELQLTDITVLMVEQWRTNKLGEKMQSTTINRTVATLRAVLSKAEEWDALGHHPLAKLKPLKIDQSPNVRFLSPTEEKSLSLALKKRDTEIKLARERG